MPKFTISQLKAVKANLPKGYIKKIADKVKKSENLVSLVLNNEREDLHGIILIASQMAKKNQAKKKKEALKAEQLINSLSE